MSFDTYLEGLRSTLVNADYVLNDAVFDKVRQLFLLCEDEPRHFETLRRRAAEYSKKEFFLNVDSRGATVYPSERMVTDFGAIATQKQPFAHWFQKKDIHDGKSVLMVARWLAHFLGFRHRSVHIFLDHPTLETYTFVQLRSFSKADAPGLLDIPVGGHVREAASVDATAMEELKEELNLDVPTDIQKFEIIGDYDYREPPRRPDFLNIERRIVYCGKLKEQALAKVQFADGEVAAFCMFSISEIETLIEDYSRMAASGLRGSFQFYRRFKGI